MVNFIELTREQIADACKVTVPNPEHGPNQYGIVIDYLNDEGSNLFNMSLNDAVKTVMSYMNM